jgi:hypothetical protein
MDWIAVKNVSRSVYCVTLYKNVKPFGQVIYFWGGSAIQQKPKKLVFHCKSRAITLEIHFQSTWVQPQFLVGFMLLDLLVFCVMFCRSLFVLLSFFVLFHFKHILFSPICWWWFSLSVFFLRSAKKILETNL